ncbi:MAG: hypothetical protein GTN36_00660 [Candidatus Aenigmarchaeota archaeon]|nr:hypothetical protein [Candidatus Aenigmarchaeota archaeon]
MKLHLRYRFNRPHTWKAQVYWNLKHQKKLPSRLLDKIYITGGYSGLSLEGNFKKFNMSDGDLFTLYIDDDHYTFEFSQLLNRVSVIS